MYFSDGGEARNCIIYFNSAPRYTNHNSRFRIERCCTPYGWTTSGDITNAPMLAGIGNPHIAAQSPCIDAGSNAFASGIDIDGEPRIHGDLVDIGCDEYIAGGITGLVSADIIADSTTAVVDTLLTFTSDIRGKVSHFAWRLDDGTEATNETMVVRAWSTPGAYPVILTAYNNDWPGGKAATVVVHIAGWFTNYVSPSGAHTPPFTSWATAATNLQDAIDACPHRGAVLVADGAYGLAGYMTYGLTNRAGLYKPIAVSSLNGPASTRILGTGPEGPEAARCAYLTRGASLSGFTLEGGHTLGQYSYSPYGNSGAGVLFDQGGRLSNCIVRGCTAYTAGGGVVCWYGGEMIDCVVHANTQTYRFASGAGVYCYDGGAAYRCHIVSNWATGRGGGIACVRAVTTDGGGAFTNCTITGNGTSGHGGGVYCDDGGTFVDCELTHNAAELEGGGVSCFDGGRLEGCMIMHNSAAKGGGVDCTDGGNLTNCTIAMNTAGADGGGVYSDAGGILRRCEIACNTASNHGGGACLDYGGWLVHCTVVSNTALNHGGGVYCDDGGDVENCSIKANSAGESGGGAAVKERGTLQSCLLTDNNAFELGGGVHCSDGGDVENCTIAGNSASNAAGGVYCLNGADVLNSIIYFNNAPSNANHGQSGSGIDYIYNCTTPAIAGGGNIDADPLFVSPGLGDFHLLEGSPCIDAGTNEFYVYTTTDLDGEPRLQGVRVDMGCYEDEGDPGVVPYINITNEPLILADETTSATIGGTNVNISGNMGWVIGSRPGTTNWFTRSGGSFSVTVTGLEPGANIAAVVGTNTAGHWAADTITVMRGFVANAKVLCLWPEYIGAAQTGTIEFAAYTAGTYTVVARATDGSAHTIVAGTCTAGWYLAEFTAASLPEQSADKSNVVALALAGQQHVAGSVRVVADLPTDKKTPAADLDGDSIYVKYKGAGAITSQGRTLFVAGGGAKDSLAIKVKADKNAGDGTCRICGIYSDNGFKAVKVVGTLDRLHALGPTRTILVKNGDLGHRCATWRHNVSFQTAGGKSKLKVMAGKHKGTKALQGGGLHANVLCGDTVQNDTVTGRGALQLLSAVGGNLGLETTQRWLDAACVAKIVVKPKKDKPRKQMRGGEIVDYGFYLTGEIKAGSGESVKKLLAGAMVDASGQVNSNLYLVCGCDAGSNPRAVTNWAAGNVQHHFGKMVIKNGGLQGTCVIDAWGKKGKDKQVKVKNGTDEATWIVGGQREGVRSDQ
jgi:hypothetical protein